MTYNVFGVTLNPAQSILVLDSWHKGSSTPSTTSLVVQEERMRPGHQLGLMLCAAFNALVW